MIWACMLRQESFVANVLRVRVPDADESESVSIPCRDNRCQHRAVLLDLNFRVADKNEAAGRGRFAWMKVETMG
jgi:hypothetical protein